MIVKRIVADIVTRDTEASRAFYTEFLGLDVAMDLGWVATYASPRQSPAQVTVLTANRSGLAPALSVEVDDADAAHRDAEERGYPIVYPLTNEPWGVRRFFVRDPSGTIVNILQHTK